MISRGVVNSGGRDESPFASTNRSIFSRHLHKASSNLANKQKNPVYPRRNFVTLRCGILTVTLRAHFRARLFYQAEWNV